MTKNYIPIIITALLLYLGTVSFADEFEQRVIVVENLQTIAKIAKEKELPILIFFAAEDCEFCERLESDYLGAMSKSPEYKTRVIIRKFMIDGFAQVSDFNGRRIDAEQLTEKFNVTVTPTLIMLNHQGEKLTKKIVGYNRSGFYGAYLDEAIDTAADKVKVEVKVKPKLF